MASIAIAVDIVALLLAKLSTWSDLVNAACVCRTWRKAADIAVPSRRELVLAGARAGDARLGRLEKYLSLTALDLCASLPPLLSSEAAAGSWVLKTHVKSHHFICRWGCRLTDAGLTRTTPMLAARLQRLSLWNCTRVTEQGAAFSPQQ